MNPPPQIAASPAQALQEFFEQNVQEWRDTPDIGIKFLKIDGYMLRNLLSATADAMSLPSFWRKVAQALPVDAMFVRLSPESPFVLQGVSLGAYVDALLRHSW